MNVEEMTSDQFVEHAKKLRGDADAAEEALMEFLYEAEQCPHLWDGAGLTFLQFIERANICRASRYHGWKKARESCGSEAVERAGVHAAVAAGRISDESGRQEVLDQAAKFRDTNGAPASEQSASSMAKDVKLRLVTHRTRNRGYIEIAEENERLREENARLKEQVSNLKAEVKKLRKGKKGSKAA